MRSVLVPCNSPTGRIWHTRLGSGSKNDRADNTRSGSLAGGITLRRCVRARFRIKAWGDRRRDAKSRAAQESGALYGNRWQAPRVRAAIERGKLWRSAQRPTSGCDPGGPR
jgi:hypothetical protein